MNIRSQIMSKKKFLEILQNEFADETINLRETDSAYFCEVKSCRDKIMYNARQIDNAIARYHDVPEGTCVHYIIDWNAIEVIFRPTNYVYSKR